MFENPFSAKKVEQKKPEGPSFEELVNVLPENEQAEFRSLENIERESATMENEATGEFEIDDETLTSDQWDAINRYWTLMKKAKDLYAKKTKKLRIFELTSKLIENEQQFSFPGIDSENYLKLKAVDEEFPGCVTPIDELMQRFQTEGIKVVSVKPESGNVFILPAGSDDVENDSVLPEHLQIVEGMNETLKELILLKKNRETL